MGEKLVAHFGALREKLVAHLGALCELLFQYSSVFYHQSK